MRHEYLRSTRPKRSRVLSTDGLHQSLDSLRKEMSIGQQLQERIKTLSLSDVDELWVLDFRNKTLYKGIHLHRV